MKKTILILLTLLLIPVMSWASPFLTCDTYATTDGNFEIMVDTNPTVISAPKLVTGGCVIWYDMKDVAVGSHTVKARFVPNGVWLDASPWSASYPFVRPAAVSSGPTGVILVK